VALDANRCIVCGTDLSGSGSSTADRKTSKAVQGGRMPEITLSLPAVLGLLTLFLATGALLVFLAFRSGAAPVAEATPSMTVTVTETLTPSPTAVTPTPTWTPEPTLTPFVYTVKPGETCLNIAYSFKVSVQSIVLQNDLPADCGILYENQKLLIPQPTPTATELPTATLGAEAATEAACLKLEYTVQENDTLSGISLNYNVPAADIKEYNGMVNDVVRYGQVLVIPLCRRGATPGPSPTPTLPPPYLAPNLLLPADGAPFDMNHAIITLQWAAVGVLRENEAYAVTIEDITQGEGRRDIATVSDTKYIVPASFLPNDRVPHVLRWWVVPVRQIGTDDEGNPIWDPAGAVSNPRVFTWLSAGLAVTPTPQK